MPVPDPLLNHWYALLVILLYARPEKTDRVPHFICWLVWPLPILGQQLSVIPSAWTINTSPHTEQSKHHVGSDVHFMPHLCPCTQSQLSAGTAPDTLLQHLPHSTLLLLSLTAGTQLQVQAHQERVRCSVQDEQQPSHKAHLGEHIQHQAHYTLLHSPERIQESKSARMLWIMEQDMEHL